MASFWLRQIWAFRNTLFIVLIPLLLLPLPLAIPGTESSCAYVILLMALYWVTEALPLAITAFIPIILFPTLGILPAGEVSRVYLPDTNWLLIGGLMISIAIEESNLHKRIALRILLLFGAKPRLLMMGFMVTSFFLSMWISNTATTAMMLPIVEAVFAELKKGLQKHPSPEEEADPGKPNNSFVPDEKPLPVNDRFEEVTSFSNKVPKEVTHGADNGIEVYVNNGCELDHVYEDIEEKSKAGKELVTEDTLEMNNLIKAITLCVPYAASIGGTATLTGTAPNLVLSGQFEELFPDAPQILSFGGWIVYCLPGAVVTLILAYIWLSFYFLGFNLTEIKSCICCSQRTEAEEKAQMILKTEHKKLGEVSWGEGSVMFVFILTVLLWFFREPGFMPGWGIIFEEDYVADGTVATAMGFLLFLLPNEKPEIFSRSSSNRLREPKPSILTWQLVHEKMAWNVLFLLGGGFAMAAGATESGLSAWIGEQLVFLEALDPWVICLIVTIIVCLFTECSSNTATASLFVPILAELAINIQVHPLYLMVGPVLASSLAFMLPAATPPNAIAFSYGRLRVLDLVKAGWMLNLMGIAVITLFINTYGVVYYDLNNYPDWAPVRDATTILALTMNTTA